MVISDVVSQIVGAMTGALVGENGLLTIIPAGIKTAFESLFLDKVTTTSGTTVSVSTFAVVMLVFGGIALAFGLTKLVFHLISRKIGA